MPYQILKMIGPAVALCFASIAAEPVIPAGAKVYIAPMDGYETYLKAALEKKKVPIVVVDQREAAEYELSGDAESQKASTAKKVLLWDWRSTEQASIKLTHLQSSEVVFAYSVHKASSAHGKQSSAEACAKHLKEAVQSQP